MRNKLRPYWTAFRVQAVQETRYRAAAIGGIVTQAFFGVVLSALYTALIDPADTALMRETVTYVWLQQILFRALFQNSGEFTDLLMTGGISYQMLRPVDLHGWWFSRSMAEKVVTVVMRLLPMLLLQLLIPANLRVGPPESAAAFIQFLFGLLIGFCCITQINLIVAGIVMRTLDRKGVSALINLTMMIFSGNIVPLTLMPERLRLLLQYQPFAQGLDAPIRMYMQAVPFPTWLLNTGVQLAWLAALTCLSRALWRRNLNRMIIQGG